MPLVTFAPDGRKFDVRAGATLLRAARRARLPLGSSCRGVGVCVACRVKVVDGEQNLSPREEIEEVRLPRGERLACLARVHGPVTIANENW